MIYLKDFYVKIKGNIMAAYFTSDLHIGHKAIAKYRPSVTSADENNQLWLDKMSQLSKRDTLYVLGDFIFDHADYDKVVASIKKMPFQLKLVMGNHDSKLLYRDFAGSIQLPFFSYKNHWVSHCPIHPMEMRDRYGNIHGHLHCENLDDPLYFNVNVDMHNNEFVPLEKIFLHYRNVHETNA